MLLSVSNIAWDRANDSVVYEVMRANGFNGLEIAPTKILSQNPYDHNEAISDFAGELFNKYGFVIPSMQSIWFGRAENIFESDDNRRVLTDYTKKAVLFARSCGCKNLVFGSPKNRNMKNLSDYDSAISFFKEIGDFAAVNDTVISIEPNPAIYNTNFINYTADAFKLVEDVGSAGFKVNVDMGTIIYNQEPLNTIFDNIDYVNHIHISEPYLKPIEKRTIHVALAEGLKGVGYQRFVSIEMAMPENPGILMDAIKYIKSIFG